MSPETTDAADESRKPFSISLRLKVMASTVVVVVPIMFLIGYKAQEIVREQAENNHQRQIRFQLAQLGKDYIAAFDPTCETEERGRALRELGQAMNEMVGDTYGTNPDSDGRRGVVFAAAFDLNGAILAYARSPGYMGQIYQDLFNYGQATPEEAEQVFAPLDDGSRPQLATRPVELKKTTDASGDGGLRRERIVVGKVLIGHTLRPMAADFAMVQRKIWFWIAGIGLVAAVLSWLATQTIVRPIYQLIQGTQRVAHGDYAHSVEVKSHDELAQLADSFNFMRGELHHTLQELDRQNRNLENIVRQRTRKLRTAYEELQVLDKMKDGFLSSISHEFRTPITSIKAFIEILTSEQDQLNPDQAEFLGIIQTEADRLGSLVNNVLDLVKIENGEMPFSFTTTSPAKPLKSAIDAQRDRIAERDIQLEVDASAELPEVTWDSAKITHVIHELLGNAIRFSDPGSAVHLSVAAVDDQIEYCVRDHGAGIPDQALEEVFKKFRQMGEVLTDKPTGTGLGLPICREIARRHGGTLHAERPDGPGALIILRLPLTPPAEPPRQGPIVSEEDTVFV